MLVSIIVPAYNKEKTILKDIRHIHNALKGIRWDFELIIVNDGSSDKTLREAKKLKRKNVYVMSYDTNHGKGYAIRYGMARAQGELIAFLDAGMEIDPNGISMILEHMQWYDADIVVGSKRHPASRANFPFIRRLYSWGYHAIVKVLFRIPVKDTQVGLKVFKRSVLEKVLPRLVIKEFAFDIELLAVAKYLGFCKIYEAPVDISLDFSESNFSKLFFLDSYIRRMLIDTLAVFYRMYVLRYYHPDSKQKWKYDKELEMRVNTGELN